MTIDAVTDDAAPDDVASFESGYGAGLHPLREDRRARSTTTTTTLSAWLGLTCTTCRHTFRVGDRVMVDGDTVRHLDPLLRCGGVDDATATDDGVGDFAQALLLGWPPASGRAYRLAEDDWQVARRDTTTAPPTCPVCAHTFRPGDTVIVCPCAASLGVPDEPRCQLLVHRDPVVGLTCWDDWRPDGRVMRCPITREPPR